MNINFNYCLGFIIAFVLTAVISPIIIKILKKEKVKQTILSYVDNHNSKQGTPTMGGIIFIFSISLLAIIMTGGKSTLTNIVIVVFFAYGLVGFLDDFIKAKFKRNLGLRAYQKIIFQLVIATAVSVFVYRSNLVGGGLIVPFSNKIVDVGWWIIPISVVVFLAASNSVNLIDGLDGLAGSTVSVSTIGFVLLLSVLMLGRLEGASTLMLGEYKYLILLCIIVVGTLFAFLLFNSFPAKVFMGDTGSLALGALVGCLFIFTRTTLYLPLLGVAFVVTSLSVIIQVAYYKLTKKRVFLMAPLHHHFERKGYHEVKIVVWYSLISAAVIVLTIGLELAIGGV